MVSISKFRDPDDRELQRRSFPHFLQYPQIDEAAARALLETILQLRRRVLREPGPQHEAQDEARAKAEELIRGVAGWAFIDPFIASDIANYRHISLDGRRYTMAEVIARQPLFPDVIREEILRAFEALRWGQTDGILQPRMRRRRRALPYDAATAELHALMRMRY